MRFAPKARVVGSIHNFRQKPGPASGANVDSALRTVQNTDAIVFDLLLASIAFPALIRCGLFVDADKSMAALAVDVERHATVSLRQE